MITYLLQKTFRYQSTVTQGAKKGVSLNAAIVSPDGAEGNKNKLKNMVFLHGLLGSSSNWKTLAGIVSKQVRHVFSLRDQKFLYLHNVYLDFRSAWSMRTCWMRGTTAHRHTTRI
jgi:pimeloyl-ACP methyl ester carboxylesterase